MKNNKLKTKKALLPYWFILPGIFFIGVFMFLPLLRVFGYSFMFYSPSRPTMTRFVFLDNFIKVLFKDPFFYQTLFTSLKWVVVEVGLQLVLGMALALLLNKTFRGRGLCRTLAFVPWAVSGVLTAILWSLLFNEHIGVLNDLLLKLGIIESKVAWLANMNTVFPSVLVAELWRGLPFFAISILAALQGISLDLYESARIDGAGTWRCFTNVTLPGIKDTLILTTLLRSVWEFNSVDLIYNLTGGGPAGQTTTLSIYIADQAIKTSNYSYGATLSVVSFLILMIFAIIYLRIGKLDEE